MDARTQEVIDSNKIYWSIDNLSIRYISHQCHHYTHRRVCHISRGPQCWREKGTVGHRRRVTAVTRIRWPTVKGVSWCVHISITKWRIVWIWLIPLEKKEAPLVKKSLVTLLINTLQTTTNDTNEKLLTNTLGVILGFVQEVLIKAFTLHLSSV